jgi:glutathione S-transferase
MMRLWEVPYSTNVERVTLALAHKGLEVEHVAVPYDDRAEIRRVSGQELVPVLEADGEVLTDSPAILRRLEERHPEPALWPRTPRERAEVDVFVDWFNQAWKRAPNMLTGELEKPDAERDAARMDRWRADLRTSVARFEALLDGRDYLLGGDFGIADVIAFPFLKYPVLGLPEGDEHLFHRVLVEELPVDDAPRLREWVRRVDERPRA